MPKLDTAIDRLVEFVKLKRSCTVDEAAKSLGMDSKQIEELSEILAESGLIDVRYEFSGIRLFPKIVKKDLEASGKMERKLTAVDRVDGIKRELLDAENMFIFSGKDIQRKIDNAKAHFREIEKLDISEENLPSLRNRTVELDASIKVFEEKIGILQEQALEMRREVDAFAAELEGRMPERKALRLPKLSFSKLISKVKGAFRRRKKDVSDRMEQQEQPGI